MVRFFLNLFTILFSVALLFVGVFYLCSASIGPGYVALRKWGNGRVELLSAGRQWRDPSGLIAETIQVPIHPQVVGGSLSLLSPEGEEPKHSDERTLPLVVRSSDGLSFQSEVVTAFRFDPELLAKSESARVSAFQKLSAESSENELARSIAGEIIQQAESLLERYPGQVLVERDRFEQVALPDLFESLSEHFQKTGMKVSHLRLGPITSADPNARVLIEQTRNRSQQQAFGKRLHLLDLEIAQKQTEVERLREEIETAKTLGEQDAESIVSEAVLYQNQRKLEGDLLVQSSKTSHDQQLASILAANDQAELYFARVLVPLLSQMEKASFAGKSPFDLNYWLKALGAEVAVSNGGTAPDVGGVQ